MSSMSHDVSPHPGTTALSVRQSPLPGARSALILLLAINLFNYIDRQVLAAVITPIKDHFFPKTAHSRPEEGTSSPDETGDGRYDEAILGTLQMAFMVSYMMIAPFFGWLADRK